MTSVGRQHHVDLGVREGFSEEVTQELRSEGCQPATENQGRGFSQRKRKEQSPQSKGTSCSRNILKVSMKGTE